MCLSGCGCLCVFIAWDCSAQITSSQGNFTFCPGHSVTLTCSLSGGVHAWQISGSASTFVLVPTVVPMARTADGSIMFNITGVEGGTITSSTMTFTASVSVISNGTWVSCRNSTNEPRVTFNETVVIFGEKMVTQCVDVTMPHVYANHTGTVSPPHVPSLTRASGDYNSLTLSFQQPLYGHECVTGYRVSGPNITDQQCQATLTDGISQVIPHECSAVGTVVDFCVVFML